MKLPWFQFEPLAWLGDPSLSRCSLAAQGAWIRLLCYAHSCEPRGVLADAGVPWPEDEIVRVIGGSPKVARALLAELLNCGVASKRQDGAVYSRRMVRDEAARARASSAASKRWHGDLHMQTHMQNGCEGNASASGLALPEIEKRREREEQAPPKPPEGVGAGAAEIIAQRCGVPTSVRLPESVTPAVVVAHWAEVAADANVKRPGAVLAARFREGVPSPSLTAKSLIAACNAGKVETVNGVPTADRKLGHNSLGFYVDGALVAPADKLGEAVLR